MSNFHHLNASFGHGQVFPPPSCAHKANRTTSNFTLDALDERFRSKNGFHAKTGPDSVSAHTSSNSRNMNVGRRRSNHDMAALSTSLAVPTSIGASTARVPFHDNLTHHVYERAMVLVDPRYNELTPDVSTVEPLTDGGKEDSISLRGARFSNPCGSDAMHPQKQVMKKQRKQKTAMGAVSGMVVGGLTLGPVGVFVGAAAGAVATNKICKARERRVQRKYEQSNFQHGAAQSNVHLATFA